MPFVVGVCARYQSSPKTNHLLSAKRIIKYINGTSDYDCYIHLTQAALWLATVMLIGLKAQKTGKVFLEVASFWATT